MIQWTHLAGPAITFWQDGEKRGIQRCCICGLLLIDTRGMMAPEGQTQIDAWRPGIPVVVTDTEGMVHSRSFTADEFDAWQNAPEDHLYENHCSALIE